MDTVIRKCKKCGYTKDQDGNFGYLAMSSLFVKIHRNKRDSGKVRNDHKQELWYFSGRFKKTDR